MTATSSAADALGAATDAIEAAGSDTARLDAELLLCHATGWSPATVASDPDLRLPVGASRRFAEMVRRRVRREPVAYITGRKGFRRIELVVDRRVLIPRPESEMLVELAAELAGEGRHHVLDVGTGSGAIALAVADEIPTAGVVAIDTSMDALRVAQANTDRLGLSERVQVVSAGVASLPRDHFDLLLANLPYVSEEEWEGLAPEIREYEPREALVAGTTGLEAISALAEELLGLAPRPAVVALEIGAGQADEVMKLVAAAGYGQTEVRRDLAGNDRVVIGR